MRVKLQRNGIPCSDGTHVFRSIIAAAQAKGVHRGSITYHLDRYGHLGHLGKGRRPDSGTCAQPIVIRGVEYGSQTAAAKALGVSVAAITLAKKRGYLHRVGLGREA